MSTANSRTTQRIGCKEMGNFICSIVRSSSSIEKRSVISPPSLHTNFLVLALLLHTLPYHPIIPFPFHFVSKGNEYSSEPTYCWAESSSSTERARCLILLCPPFFSLSLSCCCIVGVMWTHSYHKYVLLSNRSRSGQQRNNIISARVNDHLVGAGHS